MAERPNDTQWHIALKCTKAIALLLAWDSYGGDAPEMLYDAVDAAKEAAAAIDAAEPGRPLAEHGGSTNGTDDD